MTEKLAEHDLGLTPREIVQSLDRFIIGQTRAKKMVAIALRNRNRRMRVDESLREEVTPKNIIMIGPTGVGKTEIARRLSRLDNAPFLKVEATKYTEVGYVGRDVESMIRELTDIGVNMVRSDKMQAMEAQIDRQVREKILDLLTRPPAPRPPSAGPWANRVGPPSAGGEPPSAPGDTGWQEGREALGRRLDAGELENTEVELDVKRPSMGAMFGLPMQPGMEEMGADLQNMINQILPQKTQQTRLKVSAARDTIREQLTDALIDQEQLRREAIERVEQRGIVFVDEIDKVAGRSGSHGPDVSREGVQRDILPIVEGCTVFTKHGPVRTDHILFIAAGAFHISKPSDLIPELQGRFPLRVELDDLTAEEFVRILTEPDNSLTRQYAALMATEGVEVTFTADGIEEIASSAYRINQTMENIGARRLYTLMERIMEEVGFEAPSMQGVRIEVNRAFVIDRLKGVIEDQDLSRFIL